MNSIRAATGPMTLRSRAQQKQRHSRLGWLIFMSLGAGGAAGLLAFTFLWLPTLFDAFAAPGVPPQIEASTIFPPAQPIQQTVDVFDPPENDQHDGGDRGGGGGDN